MTGRINNFQVYYTSCPRNVTVYLARADWDGVRFYKTRVVLQREACAHDSRSITGYLKLLYLN